MLVIGSGLMLRSFAALQQVDAGFRPEWILTFGVFLPASSYPDGMAQLAFHERLSAELRAQPGVRTVSAMSGLPPQRQVVANDMVIEDYNFQPNTGMAPPNADHWQFATADYLQTLGIELASGRGFTAADGPDAPPVAMINEAFARVFYKDMDPVGRRLRPSLATPGPWLTIIGVVRDVKQNGLDEEVGTEVYFHYPQAAALAGVPRAMNVVLRTDRDPLSLLDAARAAVAAIDPTLPLSNPRSMESVVHASVAQPRFLTLLLGIFAAVALALAAVGTYGAMAYNVEERRQEIGIRMALGARQREVLSMVLSQGLIVAGAGLLLGVAGALGLTRFLSSMLYGVGARDTIAFITAPLVLGVVATAACAIPALRATRVDPARTLRQD
jgi:predicted permease